jgi:hypothetical protein
MIRKLSLLFAISGLLALPLSASALGISVVNVTSSGGSTTLLQNGDVVTVDLSVENSTQTALAGAGIAVGGFDVNGNGIADDGLAVTGGVVASDLFSAFYSAGPPAVHLGGLSNVNANVKLVGDPGVPIPGPLFQPPIEAHAVLFEGVTVDPAGVSGDGTFDPGILGGTTATEAHFRVTLQAVSGSLTGLTDITVNFGALSEYGQVIVGTDASILAFTNDSLTFTLAPEPGTAVLMGLGLAGLATTRQRR